MTQHLLRNRGKGILAPGLSTTKAIPKTLGTVVEDLESHVCDLSVGKTFLLRYKRYGQ